MRSVLLKLAALLSDDLIANITSFFVVMPEEKVLLVKFSFTPVHAINEKFPFETGTSTSKSRLRVTFCLLTEVTSLPSSSNANTVSDDASPMNVESTAQGVIEKNFTYTPWGQSSKSS